jgi:hypothetical protein
MTSTDAPVLFDGCRAQVEELLDAHVDMGLVERVIDASALGRDERDALWLWASGRSERLMGDGGRLQPAMTAGAGHD